MTATGSIRRERLLDACADSRVVLLVAPYGAGKTVLAGQLAGQSSGPLARVDGLDSPDALADAICASWGLAAAARAGGLAPLCSSLEGPGTIVVDELASEAGACALVPELVAAVPAGVRLVVCTRWRSVLSALDVVKYGAEGRLVVLGLEDLRFDAGELAEMGSPGAPHRGWPIAAAAASGTHGAGDAALCRAALAAAPERVRSIVSLLAPAGEVPEVVVHAVAGATIESLADWTWRLSPAIASVDAGVVRFAPAASATPSSTPVPLDVAAVDAAAAGLDTPGQARAAVEALILLQRWDAVSELLTRHARGLLDEGRGTALARWVNRIPPEQRTLTLAFASAYAGLHTGESGVADLKVLHDRIWSEEPELGPWAAAMLVWAMLGIGDSRCVGFCARSLTHVLGGIPQPHELERRLSALPRASRGDALRLVMAAVQLLLLTRQREARAQARAMVAEVEQSLLRLGQSVEEMRAIFASGDVFTGGRLPGDPAVSVLPSVDSAPRTTGMWCLLRLMFVAVRFGDVGLLRALVERLESWLARVPDLCAGDVSPPAMSLAAMRYFVAMLVGDASAVGEFDIEAMWRSHLAHHTNSARVSAILISVVHLESGDVAGARLWCERAAERRDNRFLLIEELSVLEQRILLRESGSEAAVAVLDGHVEMNRANGHPGTVAMLQRWIAMDLVALGRRDDAGTRLDLAVAAGEVPPDWLGLLGEDASGADAASTPHDACAEPCLRLLAPEVTLDNGVGGSRAVRGRQGMLVALLATSDGRVEVDRAVDLMFGETDVEAGRQRLYTTVYRTRKQLGLGPDSLRVEDGVVRLGDDGVRVDVWDFERGVDAPSGGREVEAALELYRDDLCSTQFAYEDFVEDPRRALRSRFVRAATRVLEGHLDSGTTDASVADLARRAWHLCPDYEALCEASVRVLARSGHRREALDMARSTGDRLHDLGLPFDVDRLASEVGSTS